MELWPLPFSTSHFKAMSEQEGRSKMKHSFGPQPSTLKEREIALYFKPPFLSELVPV